MLKKLRRKFIFIAMISIFVVLTVIIAGINLINYANVISESDALIETLASNNGRFDEIGGGKFDNFSPETPFTTRYFTVTFSEYGSVTAVNTENIVAVSSEEAIAYATQILQKGKSSGFLNHFRYRAVSSNTGIMYIFLDCETELSSFYTFLLVSILISVIGILVIFLLVYIFSGIVVKPIAESYDKQRQFITDAGHELKTPLTIISANNEVIELEHGESEWTKSTQNQIKRLSSLTENLILLARMEEAGEALPFTDFSLTEAVADTAQSFQTLSAARGKQLLVKADEEIVINGNERSIRQMLSLLLDNAVKYSSDHSNICLSLADNGKRAEIVVSNRVDEIEKGEHEEYFERFYRSDRSRNSQTGGNGIGLSVVKAIVDQHNGKISCYSSDEHNIEFRILLEKSSR